MSNEIMKTIGLVLSDLEIVERLVAIDGSCIFVSPLIDPCEQVGPSSLDLRLGTELIVTSNIAGTHIDLTAPSSLSKQLAEYYENRSVLSRGNFVLHPGEFALASTLEFIRLPRDIAGRLEGRSSFGRLGLQVHATAGFVDPQFEGVLTFELINSGKLPIKLAPGIRLGQICFFKVENVQLGYLEKKNSKYGRHLSVEFSRIDQDGEVKHRSSDMPS